MLSAEGVCRKMMIIFHTLILRSADRGRLVYLSEGVKFWNSRRIWNHETIDTTKPMKTWNHWHHETYETTKPLTPRNYETMKPLTPRNLWNYATLDTTKPMKPWNYWHHETYETTKPMTPRNLWNHETIMILISINSCTVTPSCNQIIPLREIIP